jgi:hypothetical protein
MGVSGVPLFSDDGLTVTFDLCDASSRCQPYRWTHAAGVQALPMPEYGGQVSHLSPDGDLLVISPMYDSDAIVYRASDASSIATGLRPYYANLTLSANGSVVGLLNGSGGADAAVPRSQLARWTRDGGLQVLGELPFDPVHVVLAGSPSAELIVGASHDGDGESELFRWTPAGGLEIAPEDLRSVVALAPLHLSRNGAALVTYLSGGGSNAGVARWTADGITEIGVRLSNAPGPSPSSAAPDALSINVDGSAIAGSIAPGDPAGCGANLTACADNVSAFHWTQATGVTRLTPGMASRALAISNDGSFVVGEADDGQAWEIFSWTAERGHRLARADLEALGVDLTDWQLSTPRAVARNARVVAGYASCGTGTTIYRLVLPGELPLPN